MKAEFLPPHLRKYVVTQNYEKYTPVDQAVWRYILRQLKSFLSINAQETYCEGLEKTGISIEEIPRIEDISKKIEPYGWKAIPVSGFIPPAAFMELQSLGVLPIASDMRSLDHLLYTPAPDIVHEAAGHAPILIHPEFAAYLHRYAQVAKKAILSKEDLDLYEAIRELSDIKENPTSTDAEVEAAEKNLEKVSKSISHTSEGSELSRMNWWTAEYGLIGDLNNPKIFGAGLLSSVGEAKWCLSDKVKKIPLTVDCIKQGYDITEPQPQLFVTPDFKHLVKVLEDMEATMAFKVGGKIGLDKAIKAKSINTAELNSGLQISAVISEYILDANAEIAYLKFSGPAQLCVKDKELKGHDKSYHAHGFGTPVGYLKSLPTKCLSDLTSSDFTKLGIENGKQIKLEFTSGVIVTGNVIGLRFENDKAVLLSLQNAKAEMNGQILFDPSWGTFDMAFGSKVTSVFGGPADRLAFGEIDDFVAKRVPVIKYSDKEQKLHKHYQLIRDVRKSGVSGSALDSKISELISTHDAEFKEDWLLRLEVYELLLNRSGSKTLQEKLFADLKSLANKSEKFKPMIEDGLTLAGQI